MSVASAAGENDWTPIADDASRSQLFDRIESSDANNPDIHPIVSFPFKGDFHFKRDADFDDIANVPRTNEIFGIDISHYTSSNLDVRVLKSLKIDFVYVKATQGVSFKDGKFAGFWRDLGNLPPNRAVYRGAYHFLSAGVPGKDQADRFVDYVNLHGGMSAGDLSPCVDLEWDVSSTNSDRWVGHDPDEILDNVIAFLVEVKARTGKTPIVYTARSWWDGITRGMPAKRAHFARLSGYKIWIADYSKSNRAAETPFVPNDYPWVIWQFTAKSSLETGLDQGKLDASVFKGSLDQFKAAFGVN